MKKFIYILLFISAILTLNVSGYLISSDYRFFVKKLKYGEIPLEQNQIITDEYNPIEKQDCKCDVSLTGTLTDSGQVNGSSTFQVQSGSLNLSILGSFSGVTFVQKPYDEYYKMFDITDEYLKKYDTYSSENIELYYYQDGDFDEIYNFFQTISFDMPIKVNKTNTFGQRSFYINKNQKDDFIRVVLKYDNKIFGLKIKNNYYNEARKILINL